jgi:hypothetical protein
LLASDICNYLNNPIYLAGCRALGLLINYLQVLFGESLCLKTSLEKVKLEAVVIFKSHGFSKSFNKKVKVKETYPDFSSAPGTQFCTRSYKVCSTLIICQFT